MPKTVATSEIRGKAGEKGSATRQPDYIRTDRIQASAGTMTDQDATGAPSWGQVLPRHKCTTISFYEQANMEDKHQEELPPPKSKSRISGAAIKRTHQTMQKHKHTHIQMQHVIHPRMGKYFKPEAER